MRALHFVPSDNPALLGKALALSADGIILDLEDSVLPDKKVAARDIVLQSLARIAAANSGGWIRTNAIHTEWGVDDIEATMAGKPRGYLIPKIRRAADILCAADALDRLESLHGLENGSTRLIPMVSETAEGILNMREVTAASRRVVAIVWGGEDLSADMGLPAIKDNVGRYLDIPRHVRAMCAITAAAAGVDSMDAVYTDVRDPEGFRRECRDAVAMGFAGKLTIHPTQVKIVNEEFTPSPAQLEDARALIAAFAEKEVQGIGVFTWNGHMVDIAHLVRARKILKRAEAARIK